MKGSCRLLAKVCAFRPDMTLDVYRGRKTTVQQQQLLFFKSMSQKGFPEQSFVPVTGNSPLFPFIAGFETHYEFAAHSLFIYCLFVSLSSIPVHTL